MKHVTRALLAIGLATSTACVSVQDYEGPRAEPPTPPGTEGETPPLPGADPKPSVGSPTWSWVNPAPTGRTLLAVGGTSSRDVWVAGEGGAIAHFDGARWDARWDHRAGLEPDAPARGEGARYFAIGARAKDDVWVAGELDGKTIVSHYDGASWTKSYPFAGAAFGGFSHGPGDRLFAIVDWDLLELVSGRWERTDTRENGVFGPPAGVWVSAKGEAWTLTTGGKVLRLAPGSKAWRLQPPLPGVPSTAVGLGISGAGEEVCVFYASRGTSGGGAGYLRYDGAWHAGPASSDPVPLPTTRAGTRVACLAGGAGLMTLDGDLVTASPDAAPSIRSLSHYRGERLFGAWSPDGSRVFTAGTLGALLARDAAESDLREAGPTRRRDLLAADVGLDGALVAADASQPDRRSGGDVVFLEAGALAPRGGAGFSAPAMPVGVAALDARDAWVLAADGSRVGVAHYTGAWSVTRTLEAGATPREPLAIFAAAKDDVWVTSRAAVHHYDGARWSEVARDVSYRAIHGSGPRDVWFAGDGVAHWDGTKLTRLGEPKGAFTGVWSSAPGRVWLWGERALLFDGSESVPVETALRASAEWDVRGIAESSSGEVFVLTRTATGTSLLWFDATRTKLLDVVTSDLALTGIRGRGDRLFAFGDGGALLSFAATSPR